MRYKRILVTAVIVISLATTGVILAATPNPPVPTKPVMVTSHNPQTKAKAVNDVPLETIPVTPVATPIAIPPRVTADDNKLKLQDLIISTAQSRGMSDKLVQTQWSCVNKIVTYRTGYGDYDTVLNSEIVQVIMQPFQSRYSSEVGYRYFDQPGTCSILSNPKY